MRKVPTPPQKDFPALHQVLGRLKKPDMHFDQLEPLLTMAVLIQENPGALKEYGRAERDAKKRQKIARELQDVRARMKGALAFFEDAISTFPLSARPKFPGFDSKAVDLLSAARADSRKAQKALAHAAQIIDAGEPLPLPISKWVSDAFVAASITDSGTAAGKALGKMLNLVGKKTKTTIADPVLVAGAIMELFDDGNGLKIEDAYARVSKDFRITRDLAEDYYTKKNRELYSDALKASRET